MPPRCKLLRNFSHVCNTPAYVMLVAAARQRLRLKTTHLFVFAHFSCKCLLLPGPFTGNMKTPLHPVLHLLPAICLVPRPPPRVCGPPPPSHQGGREPAAGGADRRLEGCCPVSSVQPRLHSSHLSCLLLRKHPQDQMPFTPPARPPISKPSHELVPSSSCLKKKLRHERNKAAAHLPLRRFLF